MKLREQDNFSKRMLRGIFKEDVEDVQLRGIVLVMFSLKMFSLKMFSLKMFSPKGNSPCRS